LNRLWFSLFFHLFSVIERLGFFRFKNSKALAFLSAGMESIPTYTIDLSLPPSERYVKLAIDLAPQMRELTPLFDEVLGFIIPYPWLCRFIKFISSLVLRRVYSSEETEELRSISKASGVELYFLIVLNVLLDSLLGCTSGGVLTKPNKKNEVQSEASNDVKGKTRMMHFRTLDWGMDSLRKVLVILEFVDSNSETHRKVIGRSITYAGFVGVLTGVRYVQCPVKYHFLLTTSREDLSISLNFRPNHNCSTLALNVHRLAVLLGIRPSVVSILRQEFLQPRDSTPLAFESLVKTLSRRRTAPCYLVICSGSQTAVIEKDLVDGEVSTGTDFIIRTNHDVKSAQTPDDRSGGVKERVIMTGGTIFLEESVERLACMQAKWDSSCMFVNERTLQSWVKAYPIMNESSHFGCILDPGTGTIRWLERGAEEGDESEDDKGHEHE
jgi:hypothetical protein